MQETISAQNAESVLVFDIGGSHVSAAICRRATFELGAIATAPLRGVTSAQGFIDQLCNLGSEAGAGQKAAGAELAFPGPFEYENGISRMEHKLPFLYGVDLRAPLAAYFGWPMDHVRFLNDAAAYLLGEVGAGAAKGVERAVCITLGTGIGCGFAVHGRHVTSGPGVPPGGEIWNVPYGNGIVEDELSTKFLIANYKNRTGREISVAEMASRAETDDAARAVFEDFGTQLGKTLGDVLRDFAPQVVVLGGGISKSPHLFVPAAAQVLGDSMELRISALHEKAPLVGAGVAWFTA
ncbi:MAG: ROK family protein [Acidobacteriota bacterium]|nr:ROK family protein [Acidobacteriota bacterium]